MDGVGTRTSSTLMQRFVRSTPGVRIKSLALPRPSSNMVGATLSVGAMSVQHGSGNNGFSGLSPRTITAPPGKVEHMIVNVWRPIVGPVRNWGLAALDGSTLRQGDVHPTTLVRFDNTPGGRTGGTVLESGSQVVDVDGKVVPVRVGETTSPLHDPAHRWIYFPNMTPDEALLLKVFDSRRDGRTRCGCHCAFHDPHGDPQAHRESIEVRCLVVLPHGIDKEPSFRSSNPSTGLLPQGAKL